ncbi:hypothetical protein GTO10_01545 [Candidatus Saccharibacteria bacterium]|nr:hypothetical protein [Candidatus Saccharibacteria bacterium]
MDDDLDYGEYYDDYYFDDEPVREWPDGPCEVCGVPYYVNGVPSHVHIYPAKKQPGFLERLFGTGEYCKVCGHGHGAHLQPWVREWAMHNMDQIALQRLATLIAIDYITGADF